MPILALKSKRQAELEYEAAKTLAEKLKILNENKGDKNARQINDGSKSPNDLNRRVHRKPS